jgi:hypothetical protein
MNICHHEVDERSDCSGAAAAQPAWQELAERYLASPEFARHASELPGTEVQLFMEAGAKMVGIAAMQDKSPAGLAESGGAMAVLAFPETAEEDAAAA